MQAGAAHRRACEARGSARGRMPAGDVLMLVRQRGPLFEAIIRALKNARHAGRRRRPAGADRAHRGDGPDGARRRAAAAGGRSRARDRAEEPAVRPDRRGAVRARLGPQGRRCARPCSVKADDDAAFAAAKCARRLGAGRAASCTPFAFFAACAGRADAGARKFLARLGPEANDAIDEFLNLALDYESARDAVAARLRGLAARGAERSASATWRWRATRCG